MLAIAALCAAAVVAALVVTFHGSSTGSQPSSSKNAATAVRRTAERAVVAWQRVFVAPLDGPRTVRDSPVSVKSAKSMAEPLTRAVAAVATKRASDSAAALFEGRPLAVLDRSIALALSAAVPQVSSGRAGAYSVCVDGGANGFEITSMTVSGASATVDLRARVWLTTVDHLANGQRRVARAVGPSGYSMHLTRSATGRWLVTDFNVEDQA